MIMKVQKRNKNSPCKLCLQLFPSLLCMILACFIPNFQKYLDFVLQKFLDAVLQKFLGIRDELSLSHCHWSQNIVNVCLVKIDSLDYCLLNKMYILQQISIFVSSKTIFYAHFISSRVTKNQWTHPFSNYKPNNQ